MHKLYKPEENIDEYNYDETCPHCDSVIKVEVDNDCSVGCYVMKCPVCGETFHLCSLCKWDQQDMVEWVEMCDWSNENGCFRDREVC